MKEALEVSRCIKRLAFVLLTFWNIGLCSFAIVTGYSVKDGYVALDGVGPDNPIIYDNDWWFDVFDKNYIWAQASLGKANLRGNIVSRDMWEWQKGYTYKFEQSWGDATKALNAARSAGLKNIPDLTRGSDRALECPKSGRIEDTVPYPSDGSRLIVIEAKRADPKKPLVVICGGPLTTVANALITNPEISSNLVVFNLTVTGGYNGKDAWAAYIVCKLTRYVDWGGGEFWDKDSVFKESDFKELPDNPFTMEMKRLIQTELGRANQLGDGAALVWLWRHDCWRAVETRRAIWHGTHVAFEPVVNETDADVLVIPKASTNLKSCRDEFFRVICDKGIYHGKN